MNQHYSGGHVPSPSLQTWGLNVTALFRIICSILAFFILFFAWDLVLSNEIRNERLLLSTATVALLLRAAEFGLLVWGEYDFRRTTARVSSGFLDLTYRFAWRLGSAYVAVAFLFALALAAGSWLYQPFLAASLAAIAFVAVRFVAAAKAGSNDQSSIEME